MAKTLYTSVTSPVSSPTPASPAEIPSIPRSTAAAGASTPGQTQAPAADSANASLFQQACSTPRTRSRVICTVASALTVLVLTAIGGICLLLVRDGGLQQITGVAARPEQKELVFCSQKKVGVDYWSNAPLLMQSSAWSAELCRAECQENPDCGAWTWGAARGVEGLSDICWLKKLAESERPRETSKAGVVSGLACRGQEAACPLQGDVDFQTGKELKKVEGVASQTHCRAICRSTALCDAWTWGKISSPIPGLARRCFLKSIGKGKKPKEVPKRGVVSGLVCLEALGIGAGAWADFTPAPQPSPQFQGHRDLMPAKARHNSLFCFALTRPFGAELELMRMQHAHRTSIFDCEEHIVYSNESILLAQGLTTQVINVSLDCEFGGERSSFLNTPIFKEVWVEVVEGSKFGNYDWTVKVDPDCVFFPDRLRTVLSNRLGAGTSNGDSSSQSGIYLSTCWFGMLGPLEVLSSEAVRILVAGWGQCETHFGKLCGGTCAWGEDLFVDQCLSDVLGVQRDGAAAGLLAADSCGSPRGWDACGDDSKVAFHPFRTEERYRRCLVGPKLPYQEESNNGNYWGHQQTILLQ
mmetsp:Transcript_127537/g.254822  ORF Transcript_127537/g.254822 Transcript_127537/m.254822 type:complete len:583 (-) Transcript_127537:215-1963(-)